MAYDLTAADKDLLRGLQALIARLLVVETAATAAATRRAIAWGAKVSATFRDRVWWIADTLGIDPDDIMACMAWESGRSFSPAKKNLAGSGATGLIQFMPATADDLSDYRHTPLSTAALAKMTAEDQLTWVYWYFHMQIARHGPIRGIEDAYMSILWPTAIGKPLSFVLWDKSTKPTTYRQNAGLDGNNDGVITKAECAAKLYAMKAEGLRPENMA